MTWPKQLHSLSNLSRKWEVNQLHNNILITWKIKVADRSRLTLSEIPWHQETKVMHLKRYDEFVLQVFLLFYWKPTCPTWEMESCLKSEPVSNFQNNKIYLSSSSIIEHVLGVVPCTTSGVHSIQSAYYK